MGIFSEISGGKRPSKSMFVALAGIIAAIYVGLSLLSAAFGLSSGLVQLRLSECLYALAFFTPAAVPGVFIGCLLVNLLTGCVMLDIVLGSFASLIGALGTRLIAKKCAHLSGKRTIILSLLPPILFNSLILPFVFTYGYGIPGSYLYFALFIFVSEALSCGAGGFLLYLAISTI